MKDYYDSSFIRDDIQLRKKQQKNKYLLHIGLFLITFITTTVAGVQWLSGSFAPYDISDLVKGLPYAVSIMFIISCHEFGHFFAAKHHKVDATLPYYIPFPSIAGFLNFGTMGAVIRTRSPIHSKKAMFDIGVAGPLAGFVACLIVLIYGFTHVPGIEYLLKIHPDFFSPDYGKNAIDLSFGDTLLFSFFKFIFIPKGQFFPPMSEIYHYPYLCVGWFGLFITAMNMLPIGQLDGGHIGYTMFGEKNHFKVAVICTIFLVVSGITGLVDNLLELNWNIGWSGWLFWALIVYFFIKLKHPPIPDASELDGFRKFLGYLSFFIFIISFSPVPFMVSMGG
jgi:membrane-associated protease RseP (regulator of RpoE activity)